MSDELTTNPELKNKKGRLGRGLGSLLGEHSSDRFDSKTEVAKPAPAPAPSTVPNVFQTPPAIAQAGFVPNDKTRIWSLPVEALYPSKEQPRSVFDPAPLKELAESIKAKGILQPIVAKKVSENKYEIIAGERRWRASQLAGLEMVPVILRDSEPQDSLELALIENIQRENLNPMEEAEAYQRLIEEYGLTQQAVAEKVGKDRVTVANSLRLLNLPTEVRELVSQKQISIGQAKVLLGVSEVPLIKKLANRAKAEKLTVRALEKLVARVQKGESPEAPISKTAENLAAVSLADELQKIIGTKVAIDYVQGKGKIVLHFYSDEELNYIAEMIRDTWSS
jgi:ParB family chromosome partitioning protein